MSCECSVDLLSYSVGVALLVDFIASLVGTVTATICFFVTSLSLVTFKLGGGGRAPLLATPIVHKLFER